MQRTSRAGSVSQEEMPGVTFDGTVTRTAQAIDVATRALQVEITLPNHDGKLLPGTYVQATLKTDSTGLLSVPGNALLFRAEGPRLAVVDADGKVELKLVEVAQDLG
jgi:multidrug efflux pump subunit AcrA (membrane-fusion protein)